MPKKKVIAARNLENLTKFTTQNKENKKENQVFLSRHFCASLTEVYLPRGAFSS